MQSKVFPPAWIMTNRVARSGSITLHAPPNRQPLVPTQPDNCLWLQSMGVVVDEPLLLSEWRCHMEGQVTPLPQLRRQAVWPGSGDTD
jgi:hypothetical protein